MIMKMPNSEMIRTILKNSIILIILLSLAGCAIKRFQPVAGDHLIQDGFALVRTDSLMIAIRPQAYRTPNGTLNNNAFSLYLRVQNISKRTIPLAANSFSIVLKHKQYDHLPLNWVLFSSQATFTDWPDPFNPNPSPQLQKSWMQREEDRYALLADTFSFGELLPGAMKEGYLFYADQISRADSIAVDVLGRRVGFIRK